MMAVELERLADAILRDARAHHRERSTPEELVDYYAGILATRRRAELAAAITRRAGVPIVGYDHLERLAHVLREDTAGMDREHHVRLCNRAASALVLAPHARSGFLELCGVPDQR
jgi:hypothetical protein